MAGQDGGKAGGVEAIWSGNFQIAAMGAPGRRKIRPALRRAKRGASEVATPSFHLAFAPMPGFAHRIRMQPFLSTILRGTFFAAALCMGARAAEADFRTDVMVVLSKAGCNAATCHGNAMGKGGFKLSLRGQDPDLDWQALTREQGGRRVNRMELGSEVKVKAVATFSGGMVRDVTRTDGKPISAVFA